MKDNKVHRAWRMVAIGLIVFLVGFLSVFVWAYVVVMQEEDNALTCYYDVCSDYYDAEYDYDLEVCTCYDYDVLGNLYIDKTDYMGRD